MPPIVAGIAETSEMEVRSTTEMEVTEMVVVSTMRDPPSMDYDDTARLALINEAEAVVVANRERRGREAEETKQLQPGRMSEVKDMVNEVSKITVFVVVPHRSGVYSNVFFLSSPPSEEVQVVLNDQVFVDAEAEDSPNPAIAPTVDRTTAVTHTGNRAVVDHTYARAVMGPMVSRAATPVVARVDLHDVMAIIATSKACDGYHRDFKGWLDDFNHQRVFDPRSKRRDVNHLLAVGESGGAQDDRRQDVRRNEVDSVGLDEGLAVGESGGAQDSIEDDDEDDDDDGDDSSSDNEYDDNGLCEYERQRLERMARNKARLASLGFIDKQETKKTKMTNKRKSAPGSLAPDAPRRRNPNRSSRANKSSVEVEEESINTPPINADSLNEQDFYAQHNDDCYVCNLGGNLLCCDKCTLVFHLQCVRPKLKEVPPGDWMCAYCCVAGLGEQHKAHKATQACREMERMKTNIAPPHSAVESDEDNEDSDDDEEHENDEDYEDYEGRDGTNNEVDESSEGGVPCAAPSDEVDEDEEIVRDGVDTAINGDPVAAELGPNDIKLGVHHSQTIHHPGTMRAKELVLLHYQEYCGTNLRTLKRMLVARLIKRLENEGRKFVLKTNDGWRTMSEEEKLIRYSGMIRTLNQRQVAGRVKVKPKETVKKSKRIWDEKDCKMLREYITESDVDDEL